MTTQELFAALRAPFPAKDLEWRIGQAGKNQRGLYARILVYLTNRSIMERLDDVVGAENWQNEYKPGPAGGVVCGISIRVGGEWLTKWDGAENSDIEPVKGGLSDSMKRAAVQWGIGRYLYDIGEKWAVINDNGSHFTNCKVKFNGTEEWVSFNWEPPVLPDWALPENERKGANSKHSSTPTSQSKAGPQKAEPSQPDPQQQNSKRYAEAATAITSAATLARCKEIRRNIRNAESAKKFAAGEYEQLGKLLSAKEIMVGKVASKWYEKACATYAEAEEKNDVAALLKIKQGLMDERNDMTNEQKQEMQTIIDRTILSMPQGQQEQELATAA